MWEHCRSSKKFDLLGSKRTLLTGSKAIESHRRRGKRGPFPRRDDIECPSRTIGTSMARYKRIRFEYRVSDAAPIGITEKR